MKSVSSIGFCCVFPITKLLPNISDWEDWSVTAVDMSICYRFPQSSHEEWCLFCVIPLVDTFWKPCSKKGTDLIWLWNKPCHYSTSGWITVEFKVEFCSSVPGLSYQEFSAFLGQEVVQWNICSVISRFSFLGRTMRKLFTIQSTAIFTKSISLAF